MVRDHVPADGGFLRNGAALSTLEEHLDAFELASETAPFRLRGTTSQSEPAELAAAEVGSRADGEGSESVEASILAASSARSR